MSVEVTCFAFTVHYTSPWFSDSYATSHVFSDLTMAKKFRHKLHKRMVFFQYAPSHVFSYLLTPKMFSHILHKRTVFLQYAPSHDFSDVPKSQNVPPQTAQAYGFSPVCTLSCLFRFDDAENVPPQTAHENPLGSLCSSLKTSFSMPR